MRKKKKLVTKDTVRKLGGEKLDRVAGGLTVSCPILTNTSCSIQPLSRVVSSVVVTQGLECQPTGVLRGCF